MDNKTGIERLREASDQSRKENCSICKASGIEVYCDEPCNDQRGRALKSIASQIEREHAEELAASKRDMSDEAREAVERLRAVSHEDVMRTMNPEHEIVNELCEAVGIGRDRTYTGTLDAMSNRIAELIEHGSKQDVDVATLLEIAKDIDETRARGVCAYFGVDDKLCEDCKGSMVDGSCFCAMLENVADSIRKALEGAPELNPYAMIAREMTLSEAEVCEAVLSRWYISTQRPVSCPEFCALYGSRIDTDWAESQEGLAKINHHYSLMVDQVAKHVGVEPDDDEWDHVTIWRILAELDKRLLPLGMEWPKFSDERPVTADDAPEDVVAVSLALDGSCYWLKYDAPDVLVWESGERIRRSKRPESGVLGADGQTEQHERAHTSMRTLVHQLIHTLSDSQERIDEGKLESMTSYWGCAKYSCKDCPALVNGKNPKERYGVTNCVVAQGMDIARRQRELDAKTTGGES